MGFRYTQDAINHWATARPALYLPALNDRASRAFGERYDGLRGFWDGQRLLTLGGEVVSTPAWFTAGWPETPMDGKLWIGRGRFEQALSTMRRQTPDDAAWRHVRFMVFDLPTHPGRLTERIQAYEGLVQQLNRPWVQAVPQERVVSHTELRARLDRLVKA